MSDNIKVVVKVRPLISREIEDKLSYQWRVQSNTLYQLDSNGRDFGQSFTFDKVYNEDSKTKDIYDDIAKPIVEAATAGFNGTIFAYGQTSSGKTYTMTGTRTSPGIIKLSVLHLFEIIKNVPDRDFLVRVSYIEIYNETLKDLLDVKKENIKIHEMYGGSIKVDATERVTSSPEEVLDAMREGEANRQTGATNMNENSSRSHSIFQITIESREHIEGEEQAGCVNVSQLNLVDLAGSERAGQTGATGKRFKEGTHINKSLSALALVIMQLADHPNKHANYRDSKLTRILQNSLGGNAKTSIICAITPAALEETISTLQFATRAKNIKNKPEVNAVATDATMIESLTKQLSKLQAELVSKKNLEVMLENKKHVEQDLQKQIANLQKLILNGFSQSRTIEHMGGTRRKQPPRRITISTLHSVAEDHVPTVPKFCTPSLKYNQMLIPKPSDFVPIQKTQLSSLPEEPARLITPPPNDKKVNFMDDVIEIDSDDDENSTLPTCSPYHECYNASRTPPCILRKNFNRAEKNYKDIVELTEREKMYKPDVVELMEKLELTTNMTAKLQDEVEILKKNSKDKDLEMEHLKFKIKKTEEEVVNAKLALDTQCKEYDTKLTDWEVSYETLQKKFKLREDELLSLLEEHKQKKCEDIGKLPPTCIENNHISLLDMSKEVSLVNSDNESSITTPIEEESLEQANNLIASLQDQLIAKCQTIVQLEANIASQKQSIEFLELSSHELQELVDSFKEKLTYVESENALLRSTVDTLNATVKSQKENLERAQNDMASYNSVIQELQIKLTKKDNLLNMNITDSVLETMVANEETVLANNENMKNIIHSFKIALDNRTKEIEHLKSTIQKTNDSQNKASIEDLNEKSKQIDILSEQISKLNERVNDNVATINKLMREKQNLTSIEHELTKNIKDVEDQKTKLEDLNKEQTISLDKLKETNESLLHSLSNQNIKEQEYTQLHNVLQHKIDEFSSIISHMEEDIKAKNDLISKLTKQSEETQHYEQQAKTAIGKLKVIMSILSSEVQEIPDVIDNFVTLFSALSTGLTTLENLAMDIVTEKSKVLQENSNLKTEISELNNKYKVEISALQKKIEQITTSVANHLSEIDNLNMTNSKLSNEISEQHNEIVIKQEELKILQAQYDYLKTNHQNTLSLLEEKETEYKSKIVELQEKLHNINMTSQSENVQLQVKEDSLIQASITIKDLKSDLENKCKEITMIQQQNSYMAELNEKLIETIFKKLCVITNVLNIDDNFSPENLDGNLNEHVLRILDKTVAHVSQINSINIDDMQQQLCQSRKEMQLLFEENQILKTKLFQLENEKKNMLIELENNNMNNKSLNESLLKCNDLLKHLKEELKVKAAEIESMENKSKEWKDKFINIDNLMKQQTQALKNEIESLKMECLQLKNRNQIYSSTKDTFSDLNTAKYFPETISPPSLLTICCNRIIDVIEPKHNDSNTVSTSGSDTEIQNTTNTKSCSNCSQLSLELKLALEEKTTLLAILEQLEVANKELISEQMSIQEEVQLLLGPAEELQKKLASHKTNLSILTATTFAENRSLESRVKGLQHHHSRFHNVCQRDIPEFKKQLRDLMVILKGEPLASEIQNVSLKRFSLPDVLDNNSTVCNFKNESTLDGDLLMLDTNLTLTTTGDTSTLVGCDQTCLDLTQTTFNEVSCQTICDPNQIEPNVDMSILKNDNQNTYQSLEVLKEENCKLKALIKKLSDISKVDAQSSPMKIHSSNVVLCTNCLNKDQVPESANFKGEIEHLTEKLTIIQKEKEEIEKKYKNVILEMPNTDALISKLSSLEKEYNVKANTVTKLTNLLNSKNKELKILQEENDSLSTQIMENISEADDLNKELERLKNQNHDLTNQILILECNSENKTFECPQCKTKDAVKNSTHIKSSPRAKLSRSLSDSDTSSRYNKICTLQSELYAGREDCKVLTEDVASIKQHLDCNNLSMDLDDNVSEPEIFSEAKDFNISLNSKFNMPDIQEECTLDIYTHDKLDCCNYYLEITGTEKEHVPNDIKIIDLMKMFYKNLVAKHGNEVENLVNKLQAYEESRSMLQTQIDDMVTEYNRITKDVESKEKNLSSVSQFISKLNNTMDRLNNELLNPSDSDALENIITMFKQNFLKTLDYEFGMSSASCFEVIVNKIQDNLKTIEEQCIALQSQNDNLNLELGSVNSNLENLKSNLNEKDSEYCLLKAQKEKIQEISSAVTLDIVKKEQEIRKSLSENCRKLFELKLIDSDDLNMSESSNKNVNILLDRVISQHKLRNNEYLENEMETLSLEVKKSKTILCEKEKELSELKSQVQTLKDINNNVTQDLTDKESKLLTLKIAHENLNKSYDNKIQENTNNLILIDKLTDEINNLKETIKNKESTISSLSEKEAKVADLLSTIKNLQDDNEKLKSVNQMILREKDSYGVDLKKSSDTIKQNNAHIEKMTSDILVLRESVKEATSIIESLKQEIQKLSIANAEIKHNFEEKSRDYSRLEINIKTHEKTAEIQSRMIKRLQKQKEEDDVVIAEKQTKIDEVTEMYNTLQTECEELKNTKECLQKRVTELEEVADKPRLSLDAIADSSRRRRQSMHDSKRLLEQLDEHQNLEALFESRQKQGDMFMEVEGEDTSGRSTPFGLGKGRDSLLSRTDQSDKDEDHSRPSSVQATRRRRQSTHDMHRGVPSPHDLSIRITEEFDRLRNTSGNVNDSGEVNQLREQLSSCQQELEDLKERYRELDEECETCAEYLKERDEQCVRLKKEKVALEKQVAELKASSLNTIQQTHSRASVAHVAVNTDADWANLHAVVVDRMSYDAEVEKNKNLTKTIETLRFKKQELKNTMAKMQRALERYTSKDAKELEATKEELRSVKVELKDLKIRYKELDEECETCAEYLKEREEQCRRLKEAKTALESKLQELQADSHALAVSHSVRKKRQTVYDLNRDSDLTRDSIVDQTDASTEISDDFLTHQVERDEGSKKTSEDMQRETKRLKMIVEKLTHQKSALEQQLKTVQATPSNPMYVATGSAIVQNQQLTDVMKENQRLKKMNAKLVDICKKRGKSDANRENEDPCSQRQN